MANAKRNGRYVKIGHVHVSFMSNVEVPLQVFDFRFEAFILCGHVPRWLRGFRLVDTYRLESSVARQYKLRVKGRQILERGVHASSRISQPAAHSMITVKDL